MFIFTSLSLVALVIGLTVSKTSIHRWLYRYRILRTGELPAYNLDSYLQFFKRSHTRFAAIYLVVGMALTFVFSKMLALLFMFLFPFLAHRWFVRKSKELLAPNNVAS